MTWFGWYSIGMALVAGGISAIQPRLTRPDLYFGVTVDPAFRSSETGREIMSRYLTITLACVAMAIATVMVAEAIGRPLLSTVGLGVMAVGSMVAIADANRRMRAYAAPASLVREASLAVRDTRPPGGWIGQVLPFVILGASALYMQVRWDAIPDRFAIHYGLDGRPDGWADKSFKSVYGTHVIGAAVCVMMLVMSIAIGRSRRIAVSGDAAAKEQSFRLFNRVVLLSSEYFIAILFAVIPLMTFAQPEKVNFPLVGNVVLSLVLVIAMVLMYAHYGQGGTRLAGKAAVTVPPVGDRTPDECWKLGLFYFNRADPAIMVEKRFGLGYTLNFANVWSWVILVGSLALPLFVVLAMKP